MGVAVVHVYKDHGVSGAKGRDKRPQFDAMCKAAARREFDLVIAWSVDRLGRSLQDLVVFLGEMHATGRDLYLHQQGLDTTTPAGKAIAQEMRFSECVVLLHFREREGLFVHLRPFLPQKAAEIADRAPAQPSGGRWCAVKYRSMALVGSLVYAQKGP